MKMSRRQHAAMWAAVIAFDVLAAAAIAAIGVFAVWSDHEYLPEPSDGDQLLSQLVSTWILVGLFPAIVITFAATFPGVEVKEGD